MTVDVWSCFVVDVREYVEVSVIFSELEECNQTSGR